MSRYLPVDTFNTGTIAAGATGTFDRTIGFNFLNIVKVKVVPSGSTTGYTFEVYKDQARTQLIFTTKDRVIGSFFYPTNRSGGEMLEGQPVPYEDLDGAGKVYISVVNNDTVSRTYAVEVTYESPLMVGNNQPSMTLEHTAPRLIFNETDAGSDEKLWDIIASGNELLFRTRTDVDGTGTTFLKFTQRSGTTLSQVNVPSNLAIGDPTNATDLLYVASGLGAALIIESAPNTIFGAAIGLHKSRGNSQSGRTIVHDDDILGDILAEGFDGASYVASSRILMRVSGTPDVSEMGGRIEFYCTPDGSSTPVLVLTLEEDGSLILASGLAFLNLPTAPGATGSLWNDSGVVTIA